MSDEIDTYETNDEFLNSLGENLKLKEGFDSDISDVLEAHILKAAPAQNAVAQAKDAILKLASERANPPKSGVDNG